MSAVVKRSVTLHGHRTSYSLEQPFFDELTRIAEQRGMTLARLVEEIDAARSRETNLSSALRIHVLGWLRSQRNM